MSPHSPSRKYPGLKPTTYRMHTLAKKSLAASPRTAFRRAVQALNQSQCGVCGEEFGLFNSRHHCRKCLMSCCDGCSTARLELDSFPGDPQRCCDICGAKDALQREVDDDEDSVQQQLAERLEMEFLASQLSANVAADTEEEEEEEEQSVAPDTPARTLNYRIAEAEAIKLADSIAAKEAAETQARWAAEAEQRQAAIMEMIRQRELEKAKELAALAEEKEAKEREAREKLAAEKAAKLAAEAEAAERKAAEKAARQAAEAEAAAQAAAAREAQEAERAAKKAAAEEKKRRKAEEKQRKKEQAVKVEDASSVLPQLDADLIPLEKPDMVGEDPSMAPTAPSTPVDAEPPTFLFEEKKSTMTTLTTGFKLHDWEKLAMLVPACVGGMIVPWVMSNVVFTIVV